MTVHPALSPRVPDPAPGGIIKLAVMAVGLLASIRYDLGARVVPAPVVMRNW